MSTEKWPPIPLGTRVRTTQENPAIDDWTPAALATRQWGVVGEITDFHDSHGLSYEVTHPDNSIGHYDPTEIEVT